MDEDKPQADGKPGWEAYPLDERRTDRYTFTSLKGMLKYFSAYLEKQEIEEVVEASKVGFVERKDATAEDTKLQFIKKCEYTLVRMLKTAGYSAPN